MARLPTTSGAIVMLYAESASLFTTSHRSVPLSASSATRRESSVPTNTLPNPSATPRSEEHTSELQSRLHLVCRLLLEKKKKKLNTRNTGNVNSTHMSFCMRD